MMKFVQRWKARWDCMNTNEIRSQFPILNRTMSNEPLIYFDNSATTLKPQCVIDKITEYYTYLGANAHRGDYEMSAQVDSAFEGARRRAQKFINAKYPEEIAYTSGSTDGLNQIALMITQQWLQPGDIVLSDESEHASSYLPWLQEGKKKGVNIDFIPLDDKGRITIENFESVLNERVKVVSIAQISNVLGYEAPIKEITKICHERGIYVVVDGAQSAPHISIDVQDLDVDFFVLSAHKLCGPTGIGFMYGKKEHFDALEPVFYGGESNARYDKDGNVVLKDSPLKFESGTQPIEGAIGMAAAMDFIDSIGKDEIHNYEVELKKYFLDKVKDLDTIHIYNKDASCGIVTFNMFDQGKMIFAQDVASYLNTKGIAVRSGQHCAKLLPDLLNTAGTCRASFYIYNTKEEIDTFVEVLKTVTLENCVNIFF